MESPRPRAAAPPPPAAFGHHHARSPSASSVASSSASSSAPPSPRPPRRVSFFPEVLVATTWSAETYDRRSSEVAALTEEDVLEVIRLRREYRRETGRLEMMRQLAERQPAAWAQQQAYGGQYGGYFAQGQNGWA
ncbi:hypothetical protein DFJ74DRAFT_645894 [Hyaloraphidium curvatum]|nr:hypothetical protein DFJ74DRAFT_645894 [Hyaloraphidium curvatum]